MHNIQALARNLIYTEKEEEEDALKDTQGTQCMLHDTQRHFTTMSLPHGPIKKQGFTLKQCNWWVTNAAVPQAVNAMRF